MEAYKFTILFLMSFMIPAILFTIGIVSAFKYKKSLAYKEIDNGQ